MIIIWWCKNIYCFVKIVHLGKLHGMLIKKKVYNDDCNILGVRIIRTFIIQDCGILIVEVLLQINLIELEISGLNVNVD